MTAAGDLSEVAGNIERFIQDALKRAVVDLQKPIVQQARRDTGGNLRLSGLGNARLAVTAKVAGRTGTVTAAPKRMTGPWRWLNDGTAPRAQGRGRHPGTPGKGTWDRPVNATVPAVERRIAAMFDRVVR